MAAFGVRAKFGSAGNLREKNLSAGAPYTHALCQGPTRGYPHPPFRMLTILELMISTLTVSMLTISAHLVSTHIISTLTISTLPKPHSERSLT